jgi:hypothetical protein
MLSSIACLHGGVHFVFLQMIAEIDRRQNRRRSSNSLRIWVGRKVLDFSKSFSQSSLAQLYITPVGFSRSDGNNANRWLDSRRAKFGCCNRRKSTFFRLDFAQQMHLGETFRPFRQVTTSTLHRAIWLKMNELMDADFVFVDEVSLWLGLCVVT